MTNWDIPREKAIEIVVNLRRRGYDTITTAKYVANKYYLGKSPDHAACLLARDAVEVFWLEHAGRTEHQERIVEMADDLRAEGWGMIWPPGFGYLWRHSECNVDVNRGGGTFETFEAATVATFESQTRQLVRSLIGGQA